MQSPRRVPPGSKVAQPSGPLKLAGSPRLSPTKPSSRPASSLSSPRSQSSLAAPRPASARPGTLSPTRSASPLRAKQSTQFGSSGNVKVAVRVRPLLEREAKMPCLVDMVGPETILKPDPAATRAQEDRVFAFDRSFWSATPRASWSSQNDVYTSFAREFLDHSFEGYNSCILAYGQTGSGKSHTMLGSTEDPGLIPQTCADLFERIEKLQECESTVTVRMSFFEIYNEQVRDLLASTTATGTLRIRDSPDGGAYVDGLSEFTVKGVSQVMKFLDQGAKMRATAATKMNDQSSRSHAVFSLRVKQITSDNGSTDEKTSVLRLVDLAGSERASATGATGDRLREGSNINKSLVTLGRVISALAEGPGPGKRVVPYRDSVLTRLLQDSLGGNSKTAMIACISPTSYEQTLSTLRYADQAKRITTSARINLDRVSQGEQDARLEQMQEQLNELQSMIARKEGEQADSAKFAATVRFYEEQAAVLETRCKYLESQNRAVRRHNELVTGHLREVTSNGIKSVGPCSDVTFDAVAAEHGSLLSEIAASKGTMAASAAKWSSVIAAL